MNQCLPPMEQGESSPAPISRTFSLLIVLIQRFEKSKQRHRVSRRERNTFQLGSPVPQRSRACQRRRIPIKGDDLVERSELAIVHVGRGMIEITKSRSLESGDGTVQEDRLGQGARLLVVAEDGADLHLGSRHVRVAEDIPDSQIRQGSAIRRNGPEPFTGRWMRLGCGQIIGRSRRQGGDGQNRECPWTMTWQTVELLLCRSSIV